MEKQTMKQPAAGQGRPQSQAGISLPLANEIAAIVVGQALTHPDTTPEGRAEAERQLARFENFKVVYAQNTADTLNICVPDFPQWDKAVEEMTPEELEKIAGGEIFGAVSVGAVGFFFAKLGSMLGCGFALPAISASATIYGVAVASKVAVTAIIGGVAAVGIIAGNVALGVASVATGIGVGIAAGLGAFDGGGAVNIGHGS